MLLEGTFRVRKIFWRRKEIEKKRNNKKIKFSRYPKSQFPTC